MRRMEALLLVVLGDLRASADWGAITREYLFGVSPQTELGALNADFWLLR